MSLKDIARKRLMNDMIKAIQPSTKWKVLVVDSESLQILNSACRFHELLDENVTVIEDISRKRQAYPTHEAIYFISPVMTSVQQFISDFNRQKPMYQAAHIFCTSSLSDELFSLIKKSQAIPFVKTFKEIGIDFLPVEEQVFTAGGPGIFNCMYGAGIPLELQQQSIRETAKKLFSLLLTLKEFPLIRYFDPTNQQKNRPYLLAEQLQEQIDGYLQQDTDSFNSNSVPSTLIIVERSFDMVAPLIHEFTYQAMIQDILTVNGKLKVDDDKASLDESDPIFRLIRHWHFAEAVEHISETFSKFIKENKAAASIIGNSKKTHGIDGLNAMKDTLSSLPEFQEMKTKFSLHINLCQECKSLFVKMHLDQVASIEQTLATGETAEGKPSKAVLTQIVPILNDSQIANTDKMRLLMLYIICLDGIPLADKRKLMDYAKLSAEESMVINNLNCMGVRLIPVDSKEQKQAEEARGPYTYRGKKAKSRRSNQDDLPYDLSRYIPLIKLVMEDQLNNKIDKKVFPYLRAPAEDPHKHLAMQQHIHQENKTGIVLPQIVNGLLVGTGGSNVYSLRTLRTTWATHSKKEENKQENIELSEASKSLEEYRKGPRLIVFFIGGVTYSEIRACYETMKEFKREVIIGSTDLLTPLGFLGLVKQLNRLDDAQRQSMVMASQPTESKVDDKSSKKIKGLFKKKNEKEETTTKA